jgi:hypothetical protein
MPDRVIERVNAIGLKEKQGCAFRFLNRKMETYELADEVQEDNTEFQGLLAEEEEPVVYMDISTELSGVEL